MSWFLRQNELSSFVVKSFRYSNGRFEALVSDFSSRCVSLLPIFLYAIGIVLMALVVCGCCGRQISPGVMPLFR
jgi:hypothetical protein